jgi:hypothetical protein
VAQDQRVSRGCAAMASWRVGAIPDLRQQFIFRRNATWRVKLFRMTAHLTLRTLEAEGGDLVAGCGLVAFRGAVPAGQAMQ